MIKLLIFILVLALGIGLGMNWITERLPDQKTFSTGKIPDPELKGMYLGTALISGPWKGKKFDAEESTGINLMRDNGKTVEKFPFKTYVGKDLKNTELEVIKIDYDVSGNPFWVKFIQDELVQVKKDEYLGKVYLNLIPSLPLALGFFHLIPQL